ncbi:MAG TPA: DUF1127 domain-containing protein [Azospirillum sp.]|nr:DUF1127 domain-containing protein [Azospirillum sp.]
MSTREAMRPTGSSPSTFLSAMRAAASVIATGIWAVAESSMPWYERWRQRQALMRLDDHMLKDIGLTRADVELEVTKPFWKE